MLVVDDEWRTPEVTILMRRGLKDRPKATLVYARRPYSGPRFQRSLNTYHDATSGRNVMHGLALHLERCIAHGAKRARLGLSHCCLLLVDPAGSAPAFHGYRPRFLLLEEGSVNGARSVS